MLNTDIFNLIQDFLGANEIWKNRFSTDVVNGLNRLFFLIRAKK